MTSTSPMPTDKTAAGKARKRHSLRRTARCAAASKKPAGCPGSPAKSAVVIVAVWVFDRDLRTVAWRPMNEADFIEEDLERRVRSWIPAYHDGRTSPSRRIWGPTTWAAMCSRADHVGGTDDHRDLVCRDDCWRTSWGSRWGLPRRWRARWTDTILSRLVDAILAFPEHHAGPDRDRGLLGARATLASPVDEVILLIVPRQAFVYAASCLPDCAGHSGQDIMVQDYRRGGAGPRARASGGSSRARCCRTRRCRWPPTSASDLCS